MNETHHKELAALVDAGSEPNPLRRLFSPLLIVIFVICGVVAVFAGNVVVAVLAMLAVISPAITIGRESVKAEVRELLRQRSMIKKPKDQSNQYFSPTPGTFRLSLRRLAAGAG